MPQHAAAATGARTAVVICKFLFCRTGNGRTRHAPPPSGMLPSVFIMSCTACVNEWNRRAAACGAACQAIRWWRCRKPLLAPIKTLCVCAYLNRSNLVHYFTSPRETKYYRYFEPVKNEVRVGYKPASQTKHHAGAGSADIELYSPFLIGMILSKALGYRNFNLLRSEISDLLRCNIFGVRFSIPSPEGIKK